MKYICCMILLIALQAQAAYQPKVIVFPAKYNACLSCDHTKYAALNYPVRGGYVNLSHARIWVEKYGSGSPAVILLNGGGETSRAWNKNIPVLAKFTTVIAYDRLGLGLSYSSNYNVRTAKTVVMRLHKVLQKIAVKPPYVLVAHSIGGLYLSYFARRYPKEVAGLVTVDANNQFQVDLERAKIVRVQGVTKQQIQNMIAHPTHLILVTKQAKQLLNKHDLTLHEHAKLIEDVEVMGKPLSAKQIELLGPLPHVPLIALAEGKGEYLWQSTIKQFADLVPCSHYQFVTNTSHHIMIDQPEIVNNAIKKVVLAARSKHNFCALNVAHRLK